MNEFSTLGLSQPVIDAIEELGFQKPTPIQAKAIPRLLQDDTDLVGLAQTGTGKTAAFGLPLIELVDSSEKHTQALVLAPTRELCVQVKKELALFGKNLKKLKIKAVYGGTDIGKQIRDVKKGVHIVVATPGRLRDLIKRKAVNLKHIEYVVLDEADEMLNMGFKEEIDEILSGTPEDKLTWLFSATMPDDVRRIASNYMSSPLELTAGKKNTTNANIDHQFVMIHHTQRYEALRRFLDFDPEIFGLVFCRTRRDSQELADRLMHDGYNADALHGDLSQVQRDRVMDRFRSKNVRMLIATDVAARGIDVQDITHVFHYNIPEDKAFYTHRAGRTGRAGKKGISLIMTHPKDFALLRRLAYHAKVEFTPARIPTGMEICKERLLSQIREIKNAEAGEELKVFLPAILSELEELSKEDLIQQVAAVSFSELLKTYQHAPDLNHREKKRRNNGARRAKRLFINIGLMDLDGKSGFLKFVCDQTRMPGSAIGRIDIRQKHTFFDVDEEDSSTVVQRLNGITLDGRQIRVNEGDSPRRERRERIGKSSFSKNGKRRRW